MLTSEELQRLKMLVDAGKIADDIHFTVEPLEEFIEISEDADEKTIEQIIKQNEEIALRNKERMRKAKKLKELINSLI